MALTSIWFGVELLWNPAHIFTLDLNGEMKYNIHNDIGRDQKIKFPPPAREINYQQ